MTDFNFLPSDFNETTITVVANTKAAKDYLASFFGAGCVSVVLPKSGAVKFVDSIEPMALTYSLI